MLIEFADISILLRGFFANLSVNSFFVTSSPGAVETPEACLFCALCCKVILYCSYLLVPLSSSDATKGGPA